MTKVQVIQIILFLLVSIQGLPQKSRILHKYIEETNTEYAECNGQIALKYDFICKSPDSFIKNPDWKKHNKRADNELTRINGKDWKRKFNSEIANCYLKKIAFQMLEQQYRGLHNLKYEIDDKIITPRIDFEFEGGFSVRLESLDSLKVIADFIIKHPDLAVYQM